MEATLEYYRRREADSRAMARGAISPAIRHIHDQLAEFYAQKAAAITMAAPPHVAGPVKATDDMAREGLGRARVSSTSDSQIRSAARLSAVAT